MEGPAKGWGAPDIVGAFAVGAAFLIAFLLIERRAESPILNLSLFKDRAFAVGSVVAVIGMIAFLGACFATSMWLGPVQHQDPLRVALPFLLLQGPAFVLIPVVSRLLHRVSPNWLLTSGFSLMAVGAFLCARLDVTDRSLTPFVVPTLLIGIGFALAVSSITAVALNSVPAGWPAWRAPPPTCCATSASPWARWSSARSPSATRARPSPRSWPARTCRPTSWAPPRRSAGPPDRSPSTACRRTPPERPRRASPSTRWAAASASPTPCAGRRRGGRGRDRDRHGRHPPPCPGHGTR
ncbi:hypothetical protein ACR6C2_34925 [Streptomyces sp. INA 01156]